MTRRTTPLAAMGSATTLALAVASPAAAQVTTGGAGNTGVTPPPGTGGVGTIGSDRTLPGVANRANSPVPGTTPGVNIGGTPTAGPPGTGGAAGGPALGNR